MINLFQYFNDLLDTFEDLLLERPIRDNKLSNLVVYDNLAGKINKKMVIHDNYYDNYLGRISWYGIDQPNGFPIYKIHMTEDLFKIEIYSKDKVQLFFDILSEDDYFQYQILNNDFDLTYSELCSITNRIKVLIKSHKSCGKIDMHVGEGEVETYGY